MFAKSEGNFDHLKIIFTSFLFVIAVGFRYYIFSMGGGGDSLSFPQAPPPSQATFRSAPDNESSDKEVHPY